MSKLISTRGLRKINKILFDRNGQWPYAFIRYEYYGMFVMNYRKGKNKKIILAYKGCGHDQNKCCCGNTNFSLVVKK